MHYVGTRRPVLTLSAQLRAEAACEGAADAALLLLCGELQVLQAE